jgi:chorismate-pyruvate lyase
VSDTLIAVVAATAAIALALLAFAYRALLGGRRPLGAVIGEARSLTSLDDETGAVRSLQSAVLTLPVEELDTIWSPPYLERLARTYWRFLSRATLGLIHVDYSERERSIVLLSQPLRLLTFHAPEYEMDRHHGLVRWRIARGLLVAKRGRDDGGYLQIEVRRDPSEQDGQVKLNVSVEVANFYPSLASRLPRRFYDITQSRIHVIVTNRFLRSLQRLDLAESRVGRYRPEDGP